LNSDFVGEAVLLSKAVRRPVKLIWTREDDVQYGYYRPMNLQRMTAGVDDDGNVLFWKHTTVGDSPGLLVGGAQIPHYDIPNQRIDVKGVPSGVRLAAWRAVAHPFNKYAIEAFIDEIARGESMDPIELRRKLMAGSPGALNVMNRVVDMARRAGPAPEGRARGFAFAERDRSLAAATVEISLDRSSGKIQVHRAWLAGDFGIIVQPDSARAQMEGGFVFGLSSVLTERISFREGRVEQSNFSNYNLLSMSEAPHVEVEFLPSEEPPTGIGELANPLAGGAVANAFAALTGKRLRHTPFTPDRVSDILGRS
jgi:isoquinoline 1-oxidoreductase beta subunit